MSLLKDMNEKRNYSVSRNDEAVDIKSVIKSMIDFKPSDDNAEQGKFSQMIKGMSFSDDPLSDKFMMKLADLVNDKNFGDLTK